MLSCIGLNYRKHAVECNLPIPEQPVVFMKNIACAVGHQEPILVPKVCGDELDFECELAIVVGKQCRDVAKEEALDYVLGYTVANDVSARIWQMQRGGSQWCRGKSFDTFAPMGPFLVTADEIPNPDNLGIKTTVNGATVQDSNTSDMIFDIATIISFLSQDTTLRRGTVILTGTPEGIGWTRNPKLLLHSGDTVSIEIEKIGTLTNAVK
jgi:2-keto-4-pentenoate hydratase/2-oxohepta-3-ene-1,7-dioic acid hydratase in catechol pathway